MSDMEDHLDVKFSVILPVYNRPVDFRRALSSCVNQRYQNIEIIVIDDCSTAPIEDICKSFGDERISYLRNDVNIGVSDSRNRGMALCTGDYVSFLDSDDLLSLDKFSAVADAVEKNGGDVVIHSQYRILSSADDFICFEILPNIPRLSSGNIAENIFRYGDFVQTNSFTIKRSIAVSQRFSKKYKLWDDCQYLLSCMQVAGNVQFLNRPLSIFFDLAHRDRISQTRDFVQHEEMLSYLSSGPFGRAHVYFRALAVSDSIFYKDPLSAIRYLWSGFRNGVSSRRSLFYLFRCLVGFHKAKNISITAKTFLNKFRQNGDLDQQLALHALLDGNSTDAAAKSATA
jgi:glycosyltransferase involved in cell wall biosynthesis